MRKASLFSGIGGIDLPRVVTGVKNLEARLKALGNAVDTLQIFSIMYAIRRIDDWLREGKA